jgi:GntR family transcriptional regulator
MESRRLVDSRPGRGTFIADLAAAGAATARATIPASLARELRDWITRARASGLARDDLAALFGEELRSAFANEGAA